MKPTPVLREYFDSLPNGKAHEDFYNVQPEDFQRFMNLLANTPKEELGPLIELFERKEAAV